jgi:hypothetical protein
MLIAVHGGFHAREMSSSSSTASTGAIAMNMSQELFITGWQRVYSRVALWAKAVQDTDDAICHCTDTSNLDSFVKKVDQSMSHLARMEQFFEDYFYIFSALASDVLKENKIQYIRRIAPMKALTNGNGVSESAGKQTSNGVLSKQRTDSCSQHLLEHCKSDS